MRRTFFGLGVSAVLFGAPNVALAEPALALLDGGGSQQIVSFDTTSPATLTRTLAITGLGAGETLVAMDVRPSTGEVHVLSASRKLYSVNRAGAASLLITIPELGVGSLGAGDKYDMDFIPTGEAVRLVNTQTRDNLRVVLSPAVAIGNGGANDEPLTYAPSADNGEGPRVVGIGYSNNFAQTTSTRLFGINVDLKTAGELLQPANRFQFVELTSTVQGHFDRVVPIKGLGISATGVNGGFGGYDVSPNTGIHYFSMVPDSDPSKAHLYRVSAPDATASFVDLGAFGVATNMRDIAIPPSIPNVVGFVVTKDSKGHKLSTFDSGSPGTFSRTLPVEGLSPNENILAMDRRPKTDTFYVVTSASRLLRLDRASGFCTPIGTRPFLPLADPSLAGMDFNPAGDAVRVVSGTQNFVLDPESGTATDATPLSFVTGDPHEGETPNAAAAAYTRNVDDGGAPRLFVYSNKIIASQGLALDGGSNGGFNGGKLETLVDLSVSGTNATDHSFDVVGDDLAFLALTTGNGRRLYQLDLRTGALRYGLLFGQASEPGEQIVGVAFEKAEPKDGGAFGDGGFGEPPPAPPFTSPSFPSNPGVGQAGTADGVSCDCSTVPGGPAGGATAAFGLLGVAMMLRRRKGTAKGA